MTQLRVGKEEEVKLVIQFLRTDEEESKRLDFFFKEIKFPGFEELILCDSRMKCKAPEFLKFEDD